MKNSRLLIALALLVVVSPVFAFAEGKCTKPEGDCCKKSPWTQEEGYGNKILQKFYFGAKNTLAGWTELISRPEKAIKEDTSFIKGVGKGLVNGVLDTVGGVLHLVTFPIPQIDVPLPECGVQL